MTYLSKQRAYFGACCTFAFAILFSQSTLAAAPAGYYDQIDTSNGQSLKSSLHSIIDDHQRFPYTSSSTDTWDILEIADQDPDNPSNVIDIYKNASYPKAGGGNTNYNREHSWPKSYGFPNDGSSNYAYTDTHHLFIANSGYNSSRSNKPYANCGSSCTEKPTDFNNNRGATSSQSNWTQGSFSDGSWETWSGRRGDVARALMYMAVRYEGGTHGITGVSEPDLILTDDRTLIGNSNQGSNISVAYMGLKSVLLQWHAEDPVDDFERRHNDTVYSFQGNRNPFIDHPEFVACVFSNDCDGLGSGSGDTVAPNAPTNLSAVGGNGFVELAWSANLETDLSGYNVYRSDSSEGTFVQLNPSLVNTSAFTDNTVSDATTYFYKITAMDNSTNESEFSLVTSATTENNGGGNTSPGIAWINELHYDNDGSDSGEFIEVLGTSGTDLSGWKLIAYNGNGGGQYKTISLSGVIVDQGNGFGTLSFAASGIQNGGPDGIALVDAQNNVIQFLSYEGSMTATDGPAAGQSSENIGVSETPSTPIGHSLQLTGNGSNYTDFTWQSPQANTSGSFNTGQSLSGISAPVNQAPTALFTANCAAMTCSFDSSASNDVDGSIVSYSWNFGDLASAIAANPSHQYSNDGSYTVELTVTDNQGAISQTSQVVNVAEPPANPVGLSATGGALIVDLNWTANSESDLAGYNVFRSLNSGSGFTKMNTALISENRYSDADVLEATTYYYRITAVDFSGNESMVSPEAYATTDNPVVFAPVAWINEIHYDNKGSDRGEFVEIAGTAGTDLTGWTLLAYNGSNGSVYKTVTLNAVLGNQQNGFGVTNVLTSGLQNGGPDGIALVDNTGNVVQFLSYEGSMTATSGAANGLTSIDIGVAENGSTKIGHSLQLGGNGSRYEDFTWQAPQTDTPGSVNRNQTLGL